ncbi:MAG: orotidine-5'-phosphate decarboxylase [Azospirillaceae bacterium]
MVHWGDEVAARVAARGPLVIGIDPDPRNAPPALGETGEHFAVAQTRALLDADGGRTGFVKFQSAFFEAFGSAGAAALARSIALARERGYAIILDVKRSDNATTCEAYARAYLTPAHQGGSDLEADCVTLNAFLGPETLEPFVARARDHGKGIFVLVKTSNPGSAWLQDRSLGARSVSEHVADQVAAWADQTVGRSGVANVGAVIGATFAAAALPLRTRMPRSVFLAPGLGPQGGDAAGTLALATGTGPVLVPVSRGLSAVPRDIPLEDYREILRQRLTELHGQLRVPAA